MFKLRQLFALIVIFLVFVFLVILLNEGVRIGKSYPSVMDLSYSNEMIVSGEIISIAIADSEEERVKGLSGQNKIGENEGMLFIFDEISRHGIWMKDMVFSIDIVWLSAAKTVIAIEKNISPDTYPKVFSSTLPDQYILELKAGETDRLGIRVGDLASF